MDFSPAHTLIPDVRDHEIAKTVLATLELLPSEELHLGIGEQTFALPTGVTRFLIELLTQLAKDQTVHLHLLNEEEISLAARQLIIADESQRLGLYD